MDTFDQIQVFERLRKINPKSVKEWSCQEVINFLQFANLRIYETSFTKKKVDGKKIVKSYSVYNYEKFKAKTEIGSLLHYQKFIIWAHILKDNYDKYLLYVNKNIQWFEQNKISSILNNKSDSIFSSNSLTLSPRLSQQTSSSNKNNQSTPQRISCKKFSQTDLDSTGDNNQNILGTNNQNNLAINRQSMNTKNQNQMNTQLCNQQGQVALQNSDQFIMIQSSQTELSSQNSNQTKSQQSNMNNSQSIEQSILQYDSNECFRKLRNIFNQSENQQKLIELLEESKGNKKNTQSRNRGMSRCIKTTERQKRKIISLVEKMGYDKCFLMWNTKSIYQILQEIQFNSLLPLVEMWCLDGFIIQMIIPLYSLRQIELAFEAKYEDIEKLFWFSDILNAIKYTEQSQIFNQSFRRSVGNESMNLYQSLSSSSAQTNDLNKAQENNLHQQVIFQYIFL